MLRKMNESRPIVEGRLACYAHRFGAVLLGFVTILSLASCAKAQTLSLSFGSKGVQTVSFGRTLLADVGANPADAFHIWHMHCTDLQGTLISDIRCGWGEQNLGEAWDPSTKTETYTFMWGTVATQFVQNGNNLDMVVTEVNNAGSGLILDGAEIYPFVLHFPQEPVGFYGYTQYGITSTGPAVVPADFGSGVVTSVVPNESLALYGGWKNQGAQAYSPLMAGTPPDGLATFLPRISSPVQPGQSFTYTVSLRFTPEGTAANADDAYSSFANTYPSQMTWKDKRALGTAYLASSPASSGDASQPGGFPTNPRRYFNDASVDVTNPIGMQIFQHRMLAQAAANATNALALNAQGVITWDIEGEQYPQATSYVCSPDQIAAVSPEMESVISDQGSSYHGWKLDDAYFATMSAAGLKVGVCIRPQVFTLSSAGTATQNYLTTNAAIITNLEKKAKYANARWGATIFYVDSSVDSNGGTLDPAIFQQLITDLPGFLFIPEESTPRYYAYTAPFYTFLFHGDLGTPTSIYRTYPNAFGANLINDVSASTLATFQPQLTQSVVRGDILMGHADYWQANDPTLVAIYSAAGISSPPIRSTPKVTWSSPAAITYGMTLSDAQLNATAGVPGTFAYSPAAGSVLSVGNDILATTFTPADTVYYNTATASVPLTVNMALPTITWAGPASIAFGTELSASQLNAVADVSGAFTYSPALGTVLGVGTNQLTVAFKPADTANYASATASVNVVVIPSAQKTSIITWPTPSPISFGTSLSAAQLDASANVRGRFSYAPGFGSVPGTGTNILTVTFVPFDLRNYRPATATVPLVVTPASPVVSWPVPAPISFGTPLTALQLNATANVPGTFSYTPAAGTVLNPGTASLQLFFTPADAVHYTTQSATVPLTINPPAAPPSRLSILTPLAGTFASGVLTVVGQCTLPLDSAGTYLMVDGAEIGTHRVTGAPFFYPLDTATLPNGVHTLQLWGHDIGNNVSLSDAITIVVSN